MRNEKDDYQVIGNRVFVAQNILNNMVSETKRKAKADIEDIIRLHDLRETDLETKLAEQKEINARLRRALEQGIASSPDMEQMMRAYKKEMVTRGQRITFLEKALEQLASDKMMESDNDTSWELETRKQFARDHLQHSRNME